MSKATKRQSNRISLVASATLCAKDKTCGIQNNEMGNDEVEVARTLQNLIPTVRRSPRKRTLPSVNTTEMPPPPDKYQPSNVVHSPNITPVNLQSVNTMDARNNSSNLPNDDFRVEPVKKKRGKTMMKTFSSTPNERAEVEFNDRGQPIGPISKHLSSYLGTIAREMVPVTIPEWKKVDNELKKDLWICIQV